MHDFESGRLQERRSNIESVFLLSLTSKEVLEWQNQ